MLGKKDDINSIKNFLIGGDMVRFLSLLTFIMSFLFISGCKEKNEISQLVKENFNNELIVKEIFKIYPSEPFKKWEGIYRIILTDKIDQEDFFANYIQGDNLSKILKNISINREEKNKYIKKQKAAVEQIKKYFKDPFIQMFDIETMFERSSSVVKFFLDKKLFEVDNEDIIKEFLVNVAKYIINTYDSVYVTGVGERFSKERNYYGYIEDNYVYRLNENSFGSDADFSISKIKFNSPMYSLNDELRKEFLRLNDKLAANNYFYKHTGLLIEILQQGEYYPEVIDKLKVKLGKGCDFVTGYIDKIDGEIVLKGLVLNDIIDSKEVFEFTYKFRGKELIYNEK